MELSRPEYPAMLDALQPSQATALLNDRIRHVGKVNTEIADWLQERRRIEELYASALRKLSQREPPGDSSDLGIFTTPWQRVVASSAAMAESHRVLALKIETDIERPLREFTSTNREVQSMSTMQGNLQSLAKDYDNAQKKADKLKGKGGANKVASVSSEMENASSQWTSQAPYVFEALQSLDESRCNHLRDVLTQYQTHEVDLVERNRKTAESTLNSVLNLETADEIKSFAAKNTGATPSGVRRPSDRRLSRSQTAGSLAPPASGVVADERPAQSSPSVQEEKKGRLGGLKRLGTVMRRKSTVPPPTTGPGYDRPSSAANVSASNFGAGPTSNGDDLNVSSDRLGAGSSLGLRPMSPLGASVTTQDETPAPPPAELSSSREMQSLDTSTGPGLTQTSSTALNGSPHQSDLAQLQEPIVRAAPAEPVAQEGTRDMEGFSVPSAAMDPISQAEQEAADGADSSSSPFKVDIRNAPISEERTDADSAMAQVASTLRAQAAPPRRSGTNRGRRDVRNTVFVPTPGTDAGLAEGTSTSPQPPAPFFSSGAAAFTSPLQSMQTPPASPPTIQRASTSEMSDAQSITSSRSTATVTRHPHMTSPGLNSSIIETSSVWLERGEVTRSLVVGELALSYVTSSSGDFPAKENIRLDNFSALEKVAPNPAFVAQVDDKTKLGEYTVDVGSLARTAGAPTVAFKYQVHISESNFGTQAPIILKPAWKVEESQTSVILSYALNPAFKSPITLSNVTFLVNLELNEGGTGRATACQSKPTGSFSKERNMIYWRFEELSLSPDSPAQKVLARFTTTGQAKQGKVEARWELTGSSSAEVGLGSGLDVSLLDISGSSSDPFADDSATETWRSVKSTRKLVSGNYSAT